MKHQKYQKRLEYIIWTAFLVFGLYMPIVVILAAWTVLSITSAFVYFSIVVGLIAAAVLCVAVVLYGWSDWSARK